MKKAFLVLAAILSLAGGPARAVEWVTPDFFLDDVPRAVPEAPATDDCRARIAKILCPVPPGKPGEARPCLPGGEAFAPPLEAIYDAYPPVLQKMFCSLGAIYVEDTSLGSAYGGLGKDLAGKEIGLVGIRRGLLAAMPELTTWASWKEQLSFGGDPLSVSVRPDLPLVATQSSVGARDGLYFLVAHEFGHVFDFKNKLNRCVGDPDKCEVVPGTWGALSWRTDALALPENEFARRKGLCFYWCNGNPIPPAAIDEVYRDLDRTSFVSAYATTQMWDDFADSVAYYMLDKYAAASYAVRLPSGASYDALAKLKSERFAEKYRYLDAFLGKPDIVYPGAAR